MIKPSHKAIKDFQAARSSLRGHGVKHEMGLRSAFQYLLSGTARTAGWTLIPEEALPGKRVRPDGTFKDEYSIPRGWWESKDEQDDLEKEIQIKIGRGYPTANTIFEDSRRAILFQNRRKAGEFDLASASELARLLTAFYSFTPPDIRGFEQAVVEFKTHIPDLAKGLLERIEKGYGENKKFRAAFDGFFTLCQQSLNPNIRVEAVKEMLVQHLLTERLIRTIFNNPEFTRRNVIAAEVEKVIDALVSPYFNREEFLAKLDRFYKAIEEAARTIESFSDKQHFLNSVYERFFQGYSVKVADTHGIVYTPQPIVDFMCASVEEVLKSEFGKDLGSPDVYIIDPCTGTGNFVVNLLNRVPAKDLERVYREQFFANEVMLMPYYIAALNIEHAYYDRTGNYEPFEGMCFVDTLDLAEAKQRQFGFMAERNLERVERQQKTPITVVIGNPPYNMGQVNENDNNKNRKYEVIERRLAETYVRDSSATLRNKLYDPYVKFIRWATDRLGNRDGIVCFVTNNSFVDQIAFDGMRRHLAEDFTTIYHADLHGNVRANPKLSGTTHNVFGIQVGVGITVAVQRKAAKKRHIRYHRVPEFWRREDKYRWLSEVESVEKVKWQSITPDVRHNWLTAENVEEFEQFIPLGTKEAKSGKIAPPIPPVNGGGSETGLPTFTGGQRGAEGTVFKLYSNGVKTNRDGVVHDPDREVLKNRIKKFIDSYASEIDRYNRAGRPEDIDSFVNYELLKWDGSLKDRLIQGRYAKYEDSKIRTSLYRPFEKLNLYFEWILINRVYQFHVIFPTPTTETENRVICVSTISTAQPFHCLVTNVIPDLHLTGDTQCFPFYVYKEDGTGRRENVTDWAVQEFRERCEGGGMRDEKKSAALSGHPERSEGSLGKRAKRREILQAEDGLQDDKRRALAKWDIFYYVYGILHHPGYREKFADNLKRELPRIPFAPDFWAFSEAGRKLAELHLTYEELKPVWEDSGRDAVPARRKGKPDSGHAGTHASAQRRTGTHASAEKSECQLVIDPKAKTRDLYRVEKMRLSKDKRELKVNDSVTVTGIPPEVLEYRLGNRSALEWVIDQYQIKTDKRSGITHDPNREDDPQYILRLVGQVIRVSLESVKIVRDLPVAFSQSFSCRGPQERS